MNRSEKSVRGVLRVLIVHFNTPDMAVRLVRSLPRRSPAGRDVLIEITDNASSAESLRELQNMVAHQGNVHLRVNEQNVGFGEAHNQMAFASDVGENDVLWLLNPDVELTHNALEDLEGELDRGAYSAVSPLIVSGDGDARWIWFAGGTLDERRVRVRHLRYGDRMVPIEKADPFPTEFLTGAALMIKASVFRRVGGFPKGYFLYWEDAMLSWKVRGLGETMAVVPMATIWHAVGASSGTGETPTFFYWAARNRVQFAVDTGHSFWDLLVGAGSMETYRFLLRALRGREGRLSRLWAATRGTWNGLSRSSRNTEGAVGES